MAVVALITAQMLMKPEQTGHAPGIKLTPQANLAGLSRRRNQFNPGGFRFLASLKAHDNVSKDCLLLDSNPYPFGIHEGLNCVMKPLDGGLPALEGSPILEKHDG
jgi:hypothetical protein